MVMNNSESTGLRMIKQELEETATGKALERLRLGQSSLIPAPEASTDVASTRFDLAISDIVKELAVGKQEYHSPAPGASWDDFLVRSPVSLQATRANRLS